MLFIKERNPSWSQQADLFHSRTRYGDQFNYIPARLITSKMLFLPFSLFMRNCFFVFQFVPTFIPMLLFTLLCLFASRFSHCLCLFLCSILIVSTYSYSFVFAFICRHSRPLRLRSFWSAPLRRYSIRSPRFTDFSSLCKSQSQVW